MTTPSRSIADHERDGWPCRICAAVGASVSPPGPTARRVVEMPIELHPKTRDLIKTFAEVLAEKLYNAQRKYGFHDHWMSSGWGADAIQADFHRHIQKGDPIDVAAYCMFLWFHLLKTTPLRVDTDTLTKRIATAVRERLEFHAQSDTPFDEDQLAFVVVQMLKEEKFIPC